MLISVLVTTYDHPEWLEKVLWGLSAQADRTFEVLIADDGSGPETRALIDRLRPGLGVPLEHVWHEDHLEPDRAAQVLLHMPEERVRGEIMLRVANLKRIPQAAVKDLEMLISEQMLSAESGQGSSVEGVKLAAEIMNQIDTKSEGEIMDVLEKASPDLAVRLQEKMFVFSDLMAVDDRSMQFIVKELSGDILGLALKSSDEQIRDKFLKNMSERAAEMMIEDMEAKGPVKLSDVGAAGDNKDRPQA